MYGYYECRANVAAECPTYYLADVYVMLLHEIPDRTLSDEISALGNAVTMCDDVMAAYAEGAKRALEWIRTREHKPSDILSGGIINFTQQ